MAKIIAMIESSNFESKANLIELSPIQTPIKVSMFGKIILAFFSDTILKLFFGFFLRFALILRSLLKNLPQKMNAKLMQIEETINNKK